MFNNRKQLLQSLNSDADADKGYMQPKRFCFDNWR